MFEVPGSNVKNVHITADCVRGNCPPEFHYHADDKAADAANNETTKVTQTSPSDEEESAQVRVKQ